MLQAQISTPNGGFENWTTTTFSYPTNYDININKDGYENGKIFPLTKTAGYQSTYGVQIQTTAELGMAFFLNYDPQSQDPSTWHGGFPYTQKPTGFKGYYKYNVASGDQGMAIIVFSKNGSNIGTYTYYLGGLHTDYTAFNFTFSPALTDTPDSVIVAFTSSGLTGAQTGSTLVVDDISFTGVTSQPALINGDFEQWTDISIENPTNWYANSNDEYDQSPITKTTDAHNGTYAAELKTFLGEENHQPQVEPAQLMTGYYPKNCDGNCYPEGGYPFTNISDILEFYYKYAPVGNDQAAVSLFFKKKDNSMNNNGWYASKWLTATSEYTYVEIPFELNFVPDSVIIQIQSSVWDNTNPVINIGSDLKIDDLCFRSQRTGLENIYTDKVLISPNPTDKGFYINNSLSVENILITDLRGNKILSTYNTNNYIDTNAIQKGIYIVQLQSKNKTYNTKLIKE